MNFEERQVEIKRLQDENKQILATPLMSEGSISPMQVGLMSERQKRKWQDNAQKKMMIESQIRLLNRSDEEIRTSEEWELKKKVNGRIEQIDNMVEIMSRFIGKRGKILPKYQREIDKMQAEKEQLIKS
jgi:ribosomal protein S18